MVVGLILIAISILLYFIPAIVGRKKTNSTAIFWLNFLLGWTVIGWVGSLVWALTKEASAQVIQPTQSSILCATCGKYSTAGTKFCAQCGAQMIAS